MRLVYILESSNKVTLRLNLGIRECFPDILNPHNSNKPDSFSNKYE